MTSMIVKAGLSAFVALTGFSATAPTAAAAAGPELGIYVQYHDRDRDRDWRPGRDRDWRDDRRPDRRPPPGCDSWLAVEKAERMGLRRARVVETSPRAVVVAGFSRGGPDRIVFANVRGCPTIR